MNKKVVLIAGNPENFDQEEKFSHFISLYINYFKSIAGGAFDDDEILTFYQKDLAFIESELKMIETDFSIIVFVGHGATHEGKHILKLNSSEIIIPGQLFIKAAKQLYIVESCRNEINGQIPIVDLKRVTSFRDGGVFRKPISRLVARERFESYLKDTNDGITICMSCSKNQSAFDFYFTTTLLTAGHNWHIQTNNYGKCLGINDVILSHVGPHVKKLAQKINEEQEPEILGDSINFPFSVCHY
jgi:hypothetical protein